jgi:hypothetical protein
MDNPYRPSEFVPVETTPAKPPWHERLIVGLIFGLCCLPLGSLAILGVFSVFMSGSPLFDDGRGGGEWLFGIAMAVLLLSAGVGLLLRRRWAVALFAVYAMALASWATAIGWQTPRIVGLVLVCASLAYALLLRMRGRLRY